MKWEITRIKLNMGECDFTIEEIRGGDKYGNDYDSKNISKTCRT